MTDYVLLYRSTPEQRHAAMGSPEKAQQSMVKWRAWMKDLADKGHLKNAGQPLEAAGKVVGGKKKAITDGPFVETKDVVGGFSIVDARDLDHAAELASGCPILDGGGSVEVRPVLQMNP